MSFYREIGLLMLGTRLKRISDKFFQEMAQIYREQNIKFEIPWFPVLYLLLKEGSISMTEISKELEVSHSAISQIVTNMQKQKLIRITSDGSDARRKLLKLTPKGLDLVEAIDPVWKVIDQTLNHHLLGGKYRNEFLKQLDLLENELNGHIILDQVMRKLIADDMTNLKFDQLNVQHHIAFKSFLRAESMEYTPVSEVYLIFHEDNILGFIDYSAINNEIQLNNVYIAFLYRNKGIARKALTHLLSVHNAKRFFLASYDEDMTRMLGKSGLPFVFQPN
jgi:DNA-binding MarR family transcriptional regulator